MVVSGKNAIDEAKVELKSKEIIIFDMDGVVIDSEHLHEQASKLVFSAYGIELDDAVFAPFKGKTDRNIVEHIKVEFKIEDATVEELIHRKRDAYAGLIDDLYLIQGAMAFIQHVALTYRLALTTSASRRNQELAFHKFNLHPFFETVVTSSDITNPKPHPEPYLVTVEKLGADPASCFVIEDSTNGVRSASAAGCTVIGITTSFDDHMLREAGADVVVDSYDQLRALLG